jgi:hypothetical protein
VPQIFLIKLSEALFTLLFEKLVEHNYLVMEIAVVN